jgi:hypothetical protein
MSPLPSPKRESAASPQQPRSATYQRIRKSAFHRRAQITHHQSVHSLRVGLQFAKASDTHTVFFFLYSFAFLSSTSLAAHASAHGVTVVDWWVVHCGREGLAQCSQCSQLYQLYQLYSQCTPVKVFVRRNPSRDGRVLLGRVAKQREAHTVTRLDARHGCCSSSKAARAPNKSEPRESKSFWLLVLGLSLHALMLATPTTPTTLKTR